MEQGIADVVETLLEDVDSYLDEASGKGANQQVKRVTRGWKKRLLLCGAIFMCSPLSLNVLIGWLVD